MSSQRYDVGEVSSVERLENGFLRADATITRSGVFRYRRADGSVRHELRLPEEVFAEDAIRSFNLVPLTNDHPGEPVTSRNAGKFKVGTVSAVQNDAPFLSARIQIEDQGAIEAAEGGKRELSCGYVCDVEEKRGITFGIPGIPDGLRFDAVQRNIRGNHVALVDSGRAGPEAKLRLDHNDAIQIGETQPGDPSPNPEPNPMSLKKITHDGIDIEVTEAGSQVISKLQGKIDAQTDVDKTHAETLSKEKARADKAEEDLAAEKKLREDAVDPKAVDERVKARVALVTKAQEVMGADFKTDGVDDDEIRREVVIKLAKDPGIAKQKLDDNDAAYLGARYDAAIDGYVAPSKRKPPPSNVRPIRDDAIGDEGLDKSRDDMIAHNKDAWKTKTTA